MLMNIFYIITNDFKINNLKILIDKMTKKISDNVILSIVINYL